jgi:uncharacterized cupin superfamily protein
VVSEAKLTATDVGLVPADDGWFVVNARDAPWEEHETFGRDVSFEHPERRFPQIGIHLGLLEPGQPNCMYHREDAQEDFLVLSGECLLLIEREERRLRSWDFVHCPRGTEHVFVGAGNGPCLILALGARRREEEIVYPRNELALKHGAGVETETRNPREAYARFPTPVAARYREGDLPDVTRGSTDDGRE